MYSVPNENIINILSKGSLRGVIEIRSGTINSCQYYSMDKEYNETNYLPERTADNSAAKTTNKTWLPVIEIPVSTVKYGNWTELQGVKYMKMKPKTVGKYALIIWHLPAKGDE